ncbi:hypothetical protein D3C85_707990 [compost metagenome]
MNDPGYQPVDFIERQHHGADHHGVFQLLLGHGRVEALGLAQCDHRLDVALADQVRIENLQAFRQLDALGTGDGLYIFRLGQQDAASDTARLANGCRLHGQRLAAFGQDDALVGGLGALDQLIAEHRGRQAHFPRGATALVQPVGVQVAGDEIGDDLRPLAVVDRDFLVQAVQLVGGVVGAGAYRQYGQACLQGAAAQVHDPWVGQGITGQQQAGQRHAVDGGQADGQDDVVTVAGRHHQYAGLEQLHRIAHGARANDDLGHAPGFVVAGVEHLGAHQVGDVAGAWRVELRLERNAAEQAEIATAQQRRVFFQARGEGLHAFVGFDLVEDHAQDFRVFRATEQLRLQLDPAGQLGKHFVFWRRHQNHLGIQTLGQMQVDPCGITGAAGRHHALDDQDVLADSGLLVQGDDFFQQLIELTVTEHPLDMGQAQRLGWLEAVGAGHQFGGAFRSGVAGVGLGNRLEEADFQPCSLKGAHQPEADGGQAHTEIGGCDKKSLHADSLKVHGNGDHPSLTICLNQTPRLSLTGP